MKITSLAIRNSVTVYILVFILFIVGFQSYQSLPREGAPEIQIPIVIVAIPYFGVASKDIETLITIPVEKKLKELSDVKEITSTSAESSANITIEFEPDIDIDDALQKVRDKVDLAKSDIPQEAEDPFILEVNLSEFPIMFVSLAGDIGVTELKKIGEEVEDELEQIQGVLEVDLIGGLEREIKVIADADRLDYYGLSFNTVINALQAQNVNVPGGSIEVGDVKYLVRVPGEFESMSEIENLVLKAPGGNPIYLKDVAQVVDGFEERTTYARLDGKESLTLSVQKRSGENIIQVADAVRATIDANQKKYPHLKFTITTDESDFVRNISKDLENNMITGFLLVIIVLFFALGLLNASFVGMAIPLSMMITFAVLQMLGITLNFMVMFAIIVALGMLVDNSVVIVEGAYRLMQEGTPREEASRQAAEELSIPLISSTLTTLAAFVPLLLWPGIIGKFMGFFPKLLIIALLASLFVALVINPVFTAKFMRLRKGSFNPEGTIRNPIMKLYVSVLKFAVKWRYLTVLGAIAMFVLTIVLYGQFGKGVIFFSEEDPSVAFVEIKAPEGTRVEITNQIATQVEAIAEKYREGNMDYITTNVGSPGQSQGPGGGGGGAGGGGAYSHIAQITMDFKDLDVRERSSKLIMEDIRNDLKALAGADFEIKEQSNGPPTGAPVSLEITGERLEELGRLTQEVKSVIETIPGIVDLRDNFNLSKPEITIDVDRGKASLYKLDLRTIGNTVRTAINGTDASKFRELDEEYDISVRLSESRRSAINDIARLNIANKDDDPIPLTSLASIQTRSGAGAIRRKDSKRTVTIDSNVAVGKLATDVLVEVQKTIDKKVKLPTGYTIKYGGEQEDREESSAFLGRAFVLVVLFIFLILVTQFNSFILPAIILSTVVLSIMGVLMGQMITGTPFSIVLSGLGVISLAGIVVNNGIVLIDYIEMLKKQGFSAYDAVIQAGIVRVRPVILTALTTLLGLLPSLAGYSIDFTSLSIGPTGETSKMFDPLSTAVGYGLFVSTALTLVFVPAVYMIIDNIRNFSGRMAKRFLRKLSQRREQAFAVAPSITGIAGVSREGSAPMDMQAIQDAHEAIVSQKEREQDALIDQPQVPMSPE